MQRLLAALLFAGVLAGLAQGERQQVDENSGGACLMCGAELDSGASIPLHRGRRIELCTACAHVWESDPDAVFAQLQPRGALFQEAPVPHGAMQSPWFWIGVYVLVGVVSAAAAAYAAVNRGRPPLVWFFAGLVANVMALAVLFALSRANEPHGIPRGLAKVPLTHASRPCHACGVALHPSAAKCRSCGARIAPLVPSEVESAHRA